MKHFARPRRAVVDISEMPVGTRAWYVCGIYPPRIEGPYEVMGEPELHKATNSLFIEMSWLDANGARRLNYKDEVLIDHHSLTDGNVGCDNHYNDNYFFLTEDAAQKAMQWIEFQYEMNIQAMQAEQDRYARFSSTIY